jgi:hypothetical protein
MQGLAGFNILTPWAAKARRAPNAAAGVGFVIDVPFDFVVGTYSLPAGIYRFEALRSPTPGICVLAVRGEDGRVHKLAVSASSIRSHERSRSKLIFHRRDDRRFLTEAWIEGRCFSLQLYRSLQDFDSDSENPETEAILLVEPDHFGRAVYVIEDSGCTA